MHQSHIPWNESCPSEDGVKVGKPRTSETETASTHWGIDSLHDCRIGHLPDSVLGRTSPAWRRSLKILSRVTLGLSSVQMEAQDNRSFTCLVIWSIICSIVHWFLDSLIHLTDVTERVPSHWQPSAGHSKVNNPKRSPSGSFQRAGRLSWVSRAVRTVCPGAEVEELGGGGLSGAWSLMSEVISRGDEVSPSLEESMWAGGGSCRGRGMRL